MKMIYMMYDRIKEPYRFIVFFSVMAPISIAGQFDYKWLLIMGVLIISRVAYFRGML